MHDQTPDNVRRLPSKSSGDGTAGVDPLAAALIRMSLKTRRRAEDEANHTARMEVYLRDLRAWPFEVVVKALDWWPDRSEWWPSWNELLGVIGEANAARRVALPPPEHRPLQRGKPDSDGQEPFRTRKDWDEFADSMRKLRDPSISMLARESLLRIGESIEARQRPHAERMGWNRP